MQPVSCPVCSGSATIFDVVDFNKCCEEAKGKFLPLSGIPVQYMRCGKCDFVFAPEFAHWSEADFLSRIYNDAYGEIDPDYFKVRPEANAGHLTKAFGLAKDRIRHLDYGGGNGFMSATLAGQGWDSHSYDPFPASDIQLESLGRFNLISVFEVFEHVPDVAALMRNLLTLMDERCLVLFSTWVSDGNIRPDGKLTWWYAAPRNGHISLFSRNSLRALARRHGLQFGSFNHGMHCFYSALPDWAEPLVTSRAAA